VHPAAGKASAEAQNTRRPPSNAHYCAVDRRHVPARTTEPCRLNRSRGVVVDREPLPRLCDAAHPMRGSILELQPRAGNEIAHGSKIAEYLDRGDPPRTRECSFFELGLLVVRAGG
jgi:hypothetical protein